MKEFVIAITAASYSGNKGAAAMLQSSIRQLHEIYGEKLNIQLMSVYPGEDRKQLPWDFVRVVSCKPQQLLFVAFPLAVLYRIFHRWCPPVKALLLKNKILKAYARTDAVLDEAGISFVDSRGAVMNTYAFVCAAVPMLMGVPVMKYSQAMGTFRSPLNRFLAKWILPKMKLICARGKGTLENLRQIGVESNVKLCADGAFTMEDDETCSAEVEKVCAADPFYHDRVVGLSISSVVEKKCKKLQIDYKGIMVDFIGRLNAAGYGVLIIANGARINSDKPRNNDLMICDAVYEAVENKDKVRWYHKEMRAEEIRAYIGKCRFLVASRFHAMIAGLQQKVPVLLVGWSHKYQEVLDFFELGQYAIDFSNLSAQSLWAEFEAFAAEEEKIRRAIDSHYDEVIESSRKNIVYVREVLDGILKGKEKKPAAGPLDYNAPERYIGSYLACRKGYAADETIRENSASGGMVTAFLCYLLRTGQIDGAWVTRSEITDGTLGYRTFIAVTEEEIRSGSSSIYMDMPLLKHIDMVREFPGKLAVVLTPCAMRGLAGLMERDDSLREKIVLKLGLYCSGNHSPKATYLSLEQAKVSLERAVRMYYRRGHWRGMAGVLYEDGSEKTFSYAKTVCAYKNAYFFECGRCMTCQDHFALSADISFGDIWLKEMKGNPIKHTECVIRSERAMQLYLSAVDAGVIVSSHISGRDVIRSQKRALMFKFACAPAKQGRGEDKAGKCKWNLRLAYYLAKKNKAFSEEHYDSLRKIPHILIYYYMCFIRVLLSF